MRKLYDAADRFCARHPRFGVPDLMRYIVIGNVVVFFLIMLTRGTNASALNFLYFDPQMVLRGEVWRIVTYIFVPSTTSVFWLVVELYFYYWIGSTLEREWGTARFNLYYWSGVLLTVIGALLASAITGGNFAVAGTSYVNLSMFLAFALLFPNTQVLLMFIIPVKMKWLAYIDVGLFAAGIIRAILVRNWGGVILPVMALLNFLIFAWPTLQGWAQRQQYQHSRQAVNFKISSRSSRGITTSVPCAAARIRTIRSCSSGIAASAWAITASVRIISSPTFTLRSEENRRNRAPVHTDRRSVF